MALSKDPEIWSPDEYPESDCPSHPDMLWEWDGYGWICSACVLGLDDIPPRH